MDEYQVNAETHDTRSDLSLRFWDALSHIEYNLLIHSVEGMKQAFIGNFDIE